MLFEVLPKRAKDKVCSLLAYLPSCLGQETTKRPLQSLSQAATCYYQSNHSKVEAIPPVKCLAQGHNKRTCQCSYSSLYLEC